MNGIPQGPATALQTTNSKQLKHGVPAGNMLATLVSWKAEKDVLVEKEMKVQEVIHVLPPLQQTAAACIDIALARKSSDSHIIGHTFTTSRG